ncbi:MAG: hypothetical protein RL376_218 [Verrucomicrobiota bacterium]|jgi:HD-like signal output (HDOD) protein
MFAASVPDPVEDAPPRSELATHTLARVAQGLECEAVAGMAEIVKLIETLTHDALKISVQELAEIIEKDVIVTAKVISASNLFGYKQSCGTVESVEDAIKLVGFGKIRTLALSLLLMENLRRPGAAAVHRKAATVTLTSSLITQAWAQARGREDADHAFLHASLRQFGDLMLAAFLPEDFQRARNLAEARGVGFEAACREVFGLTAGEVGYEHLKAMKLPATMLAGLKPFTPELLAGTRSDDTTQFLLASEMGRQVAELTLREDLGPEVYAARMWEVRNRFRKCIGLDDDVLRSVFMLTEQRLDSFGRAFGVNVVARGIAQRFAKQRASALVKEAPRQVEEGAVDAADAMPAVAPGGSNPPLVGGEGLAAVYSIASNAAEGPAATVLERLMEAVAAAGARLAGKNPGTMLSDLLSLCDRVLQECWGTETLVVFWENAQGRYAAGTMKGVTARRGPASFFASDRTVFGVAATRQETVRIHDAGDARIRPHLPIWFQAELGLKACLIVPAGDVPGKRLVLCFGWSRSQRVDVSRAELGALRALLGLIVAARQKADAA